MAHRTTESDIDVALVIAAHTIKRKAYVTSPKTLGRLEGSSLMTAVVTDMRKAWACDAFHWTTYQYGTERTQRTAYRLQAFSGGSSGVRDVGPSFFSAEGFADALRLIRDIRP